MLRHPVLIKTNGIVLMGEGERCLNEVKKILKILFVCVTELDLKHWVR